MSSLSRLFVCFIIALVQIQALQCGVGKFRLSHGDFLLKDDIFNGDFSSDFFALEGSVPTRIMNYLTCAAQERNMYASSMNGECVRCPAGTYKNVEGDHVGQCLRCPLGMWSVDDGTECACQPGTVLKGHICVPCFAGSYKAGISNSTVCTLCPSNAVVVAGQQCRDSCMCPIDQVFDVISGDCVSVTESYRNLASETGGSGSAGDEIQATLKFDFGTANLNWTNTTIRNTLSTAVSYSVASTLMLAPSDITIKSIAICPGDSLCSNSGQRRLGTSSWVEVIISIQTYGTTTAQDVSQSLQASTAKTTISTAVGTMLTEVTGQAVSAAVTPVVVQPLPPSDDTNTAALSGGAIAAIVIVCSIVLIGGIFVFVKLFKAKQDEKFSATAENIATADAAPFSPKGVELKNNA